MRLIDADGLKKSIKEDEELKNSSLAYLLMGLMTCYIDEAPTIDAVPMVHLEKWLYEIALNNTDNYLADACEEIISRLDGLRRFSKEENDEID